MKESIPSELRSCVALIFFFFAVVPFTSAKPISIFSTRDREPLPTDEATLLLKHLKDSKQSHSYRSAYCFNILHYASTNYQLKIKEVLIVCLFVYFFL